MYWLLGRKSKLSTNNKLPIYKVILKPIWTYGIQLCDTTSNSNIEILERFQTKVLRLIVMSPGTCRILSSVRTFKYQQSKKKSADSAPIMIFASVYTPMNSSPHSPSRQSTGTCVDTGQVQKLSDPEGYAALSGPFRVYCTLLEVQKPSDLECYAPLSGPFSFYCTLLGTNH
jgi:hypothetical protein